MFLGDNSALSGLNTLRPRQNIRLFPDDYFKYTFVNENIWILILKFVPNGPFNNIPALVQIMAWRRPGDKTLSEPMVAYFADAYYASPGLNELSYNSAWSGPKTYTSWHTTRVWFEKSLQ